MKIKHRPIQLLAIALILCFGCNNKPVTEVDITDYHHEYLIYVLSPADSEALCEASFQKGGKANMASALPGGYEVFLDDQKTVRDEDEHPLYRTERNVPDVFGEHTWKLKYNGNTLIEVPILFSKITLADSFPATIGPNDVTIKLNGAQDGDRLECVFEDRDAGFKQFFYTIANNVATIPAADIKKIGPGGYLLDMSVVRTKPAVYKGKETGIVETDYTFVNGEGVVVNQ